MCLLSWTGQADLWAAASSSTALASLAERCSVLLSVPPQSIDLCPQRDHLTAQQLDLSGQADQGQALRCSRLIQKWPGGGLPNVNEQLAVPRLLSARQALEASCE